MNNIVHLLLEDFNIIVNSQIDCIPSQYNFKPKIFNDFEVIGLIDLYRKLNKEMTKNTYQKEEISIRIDQIWMFKAYSNNLLNFLITPSMYIIHSDYNIIIAILNIIDLIRNNRINTIYDNLPKSSIHSKIIYNCNNLKKSI